MRTKPRFHVILRRHLSPVLPIHKGCSSQNPNRILPMVSVCACKSSIWAFMSLRIAVSWLSASSVIPEETNRKIMWYTSLHLLPVQKYNMPRSVRRPSVSLSAHICSVYISLFFSTLGYTRSPSLIILYVPLLYCCNISKSIQQLWSAPFFPSGVFPQPRRG